MLTFPLCDLVKRSSHGSSGYWQRAQLRTFSRPDLEPGAVPEAALSGAVTLPRNGAVAGGDSERNGGAGNNALAPPGHVPHLPGVRKRDSVESAAPRGCRSVV